MASNSKYADGGAFLGVAQFLLSGPPNLTADGYRNFQCDAAGNLCVNVRAGGGSGGSLGAVTIADPTTETNQAAVQLPGVSGIYAMSVQGVLGGTPMPVSGTFSISGSTVTANAGTGFPTASAPGTPGTQLTTVQGSPSGTPLPVSGAFFQSTQPVSLVTLPALTTGAATIGIVNAGIGFPSLTTAGTSGANLTTVQGSPTGVPVPVSGSFFQVTQPVSLASLPSLATGANTIGTVNAGSGFPSPTVAGTSASGANLLTVQGSPTGVPLLSTITQGGNAAVVSGPSADGNSAQNGLATYTQCLIYNGTTWDRLRGTGGAVNTIVTGTAAISAAALPLPAGAATSANQLVGGSAVSATNPLPTTVGQFARVDKSGTITAGGTAQTLFAAAAITHGGYFQNLSTVNMWIRDDGTAASAGPGSVLVPANGGFFYWDNTGVPTTSVSIFCATTASQFTCKVW